ncbi:hypothetical protein H671_6g16854 [Cricetulus griseus]|nr:hypothetical protein H671_6g16854 [Cricetulus griseus]
MPELCTLQLDAFPTKRLWNPLICLFATIRSFSVSGGPIYYLLLSCANVFKAISHFLFYEVQCGWIYVEVFDPFGLEFCA